MSKTYRDPFYRCGYTNKESMLKETWTNWRTGIPEPLYDESDWAKASRDRKFDYGRRKAYREVTNKEIRKQNRIDCHRIMKDPEDSDDMTFATIMNGKHHAWSIW